jgi:6-pyruvoyltetrahydropterin/6-carboxytetrahydropterin synthase
VSAGATGSPESPFHVFVGKEYLKFNAAHFISYPGFRERLHGHNYRVAVRIDGDLGGDGYVVDFGMVKQVTRRVCAELDERTILPARSDSLQIVERGESIEVVCEDGGRFLFPKDDVALLPIVHSSAEELARYVAERVREGLQRAGARPWRRLEVSVAETAGQFATYAE